MDLRELSLTGSSTREERDGPLLDRIYDVSRRKHIHSTDRCRCTARRVELTVEECLDRYYRHNSSRLADFGARTIQRLEKGTGAMSQELKKARQSACFKCPDGLHLRRSFGEQDLCEYTADELVDAMVMTKRLEAQSNIKLDDDYKIVDPADMKFGKIGRVRACRTMNGLSKAHLLERAFDKLSLDSDGLFDEDDLIEELTGTTSEKGNAFDFVFHGRTDNMYREMVEFKKDGRLILARNGSRAEDQSKQYHWNQQGDHADALKQIEEERMSTSKLAKKIENYDKLKKLVKDALEKLALENEVIDAGKAYGLVGMKQMAYFYGDDGEGIKIAIYNLRPLLEDIAKEPGSKLTQTVKAHARRYSEFIWRKNDSLPLLDRRQPGQFFSNAMQVEKKKEVETDRKTTGNPMLHLAVPKLDDPTPKLSGFIGYVTKIAKREGMDLPTFTNTSDKPSPEQKTGIINIVMELDERRKKMAEQKRADLEAKHMKAADARLSNVAKDPKPASRTSPEPKDDALTAALKKAGTKLELGVAKPVEEPKPVVPTASHVPIEAKPFDNKLNEQNFAALELDIAKLQERLAEVTKSPVLSTDPDLKESIAHLAEAEELAKAMRHTTMDLLQRYNHHVEVYDNVIIEAGDYRVCGYKKDGKIVWQFDKIIRL